MPNKFFFIIKAAGVFSAIAAVVYYYGFSTPKQYERSSVQVLDQMQATFRTQELFQISNTLRTLVNSQAKIHLEVHYPVKGQKDVVKAKDFDKEDFVNYMIGLFSDAKNYTFTPTVTNVTSNSTGTSEVVQFEARIEADAAPAEGASKSNRHFVVDSVCVTNIINNTESEKIDIMNGSSHPIPTQFGSFNCVAQLQ
jgi:hypothetical protein